MNVEISVMRIITVLCIILNNKLIVSEESDIEKILNHRIRNEQIEVEVKWDDDKEKTWEPLSNIISKTPLTEYLESHDINLKEQIAWELWCHSDEDPSWFEEIPAAGRETSRGIKAGKDIEEGSFLLEYKGFLSLREDVEPAADEDYVFDVEHEGKNYSIDATSENDTCFGRLVNDAHPRSGKINCEMRKLILKNNEQSVRLVLIATRDIKLGEELFYFYGSDDQPWYESKENKSQLILLDNQVVEKVVNHRLKKKKGIEVELKLVDETSTTWKLLSHFIPRQPLRDYMKSHELSLKDRGTWDLWCHLNEDPAWIDIVDPVGRESGRGIKATKDIEKGSFILDCKGLFTLTEDVDIAVDWDYTFDIYHKGTDYTLDASSEDGSLCRLINDAHPSSGKVNSEYKLITLKNNERDIRLLLVAARDIKPGEELFIFYGSDDQPWYDSYNKSTEEEPIEKEKVVKILNHRRESEDEDDIEVEVQWVDEENTTWETLTHRIPEEPLRQYVKSHDFKLKNRTTLELWCFANEDPPWFEVIPAAESETDHGVRILKDVEKGSFLLEYRGNLSLSQDVPSNHYKHVFDFHYKGENYSMDSTVDDNSLGRLVKEAPPSSENINCVLRKISLPESNRKIRLVLVSTRDIKHGEELFYYYGFDLKRREENKQPKKIEFTRSNSDEVLKSDEELTSGTRRNEL